MTDFTGSEKLPDGAILNETIDGLFDLHLKTCDHHKDPFDAVMCAASSILVALVRTLHVRALATVEPVAKEGGLASAENSERFTAMFPLFVEQPITYFARDVYSHFGERRDHYAAHFNHLVASQLIGASKALDLGVYDQ